MQSVFIKSGNQIFNREQVTGAEYRKVAKEEAMFLGFRGNRSGYSILHIFTVDGHDWQFVNDEADILWDVLSDLAINLTPKASVAKE